MVADTVPSVPSPGTRELRSPLPAHGRGPQNSRSTNGLPALSLACREASACWSKLSSIERVPAARYCLCLRSGPDLLLMEAIVAHAALRYGEVARTLVHALKYQDRTDLGPAIGRLDGARRPQIARWRRHADPAAAALAPPRTAATTSRARWRGRPSGRAASGCDVTYCNACAAPNSSRAVAGATGQQCAGRIQGIPTGEPESPAGR